MRRYSLSGSELWQRTLAANSGSELWQRTLALAPSQRRRTTTALHSPSKPPYRTPQPMWISEGEVDP
jgi:hypothetical protein